MASAVKSSRRSLPALLMSSSSSSSSVSSQHQKKLSVPSGPTFTDTMTHDLDLYYIRQIASHMKEFDLEQKIDVEIRIREGTTKLLAACQHPSQALEAAKTLQTSSERMNVYTSELQRRKQRLLGPSSTTPAASTTSAAAPTTTGAPSTTPTAGSACSGRLGLTDLRFPLMWKDTDHFKNRGDYRRFAVFLLAKVGTEVLDTSLITPVDRSATDITFPDNLVFTAAKADFKMKLEVYSCMLQDDLSIASTPRKLQKSLHTSISRTLGRKLSSTLKDASSSQKNNELGPKFDLVATATLSLDEVHDSIKSHDLVLENLENPCHQLPLFDHFCCRLAAEPQCLSQSSEQLTASVTFLSVDSPSTAAAAASSSSPASGAAFAVIKGLDLQLFKKKAHRDKGCLPLISVSLCQVTAVLEDAQRGSCSFTTYDVYQEKRLDVFCSDAEWLKALSQRIVDAAAWARAAKSNKPMVIHSPQPTNGSPNSRWAPRTGSLYEETPLFEEPKSNRRPTVHEVFSLSRIDDPQPMLPPAAPPSPPNTRSRSSSTSTSSSSLPSWGSVRGLPNFWRFARASIRK